MPRPPRPADLPSPKAAGRAAASFVERLVTAMASWSSRRANAPDSSLVDLAAIVAGATEPGAVASALVRLSHRAAGPGSRRAEVWRGPVRVAAWPEGSAPGRDAAATGASATPVEIPLRCAGRERGTLRVVVDAKRPLGTDRLRRLEALAVLAAAADAALASGEAGVAGPEPVPAAHPTHDQATGLPNALFFESFLAYALALADRRDEPLSLLYIGVDRLTAIRQLHGAGVGSEALRKVGRTVAQGLRGSDLLARLDEGRLVAVLPGASAEAACRIAEHLRGSVLSSGAATPTMPLLTASIGVASFPEHAGDALTLRSAAAAALSEARSRGRGEVASAPPARLAEPPTLLRLVQHVG